MGSFRKMSLSLTFLTLGSAHSMNDNLDSSLAHNKRFTVVTAKDAPITDLRYGSLLSATLRDMIDDLILDRRGLMNVPDNFKIPLPQIEWGIMKLVLKHMDFALRQETSGVSSNKIIAYVGYALKNIEHYEISTIKKILDAYDFLGFHHFKIPLYVILAYKINWDNIIDITKLSKNDIINIKKAYWFLCNKNLTQDEPAQISLQDLLDYEVISEEDARPFAPKNDIAGYIDLLYSQQSFDTLAKILTILDKNAASLAHKARLRLMLRLRSLMVFNEEQLKTLFDQCKSESVVKMAIRLFYAIKFDKDLDALPMASFVKNFDQKQVENRGIDEKDPFFSKPHLQNLMPLFEFISE